jgi:WD40 repeat protein
MVMVASTARVSHPRLRPLAALLVFLGYLLAAPLLTGRADEETKKPPAKERPLGQGIRCVAFSGDGALLAASLGEPKQRGRVVLWDVARRKELWSHEEGDGVPALVFSPDGKTLAIAEYDHTARLLDSATGRTVMILRGHTKYVRAVAFSPDGKTLATGGWDHAVKLWDLPGGTERNTLDWPGEQLFSLCYSPGGRWLMAAGGEARIWDAATSAEKLTVRPYHAPCAVFVDDNWFLTGGYDGAIRLWSMTTGKQRLRLHGIGGVDRLAFSAPAGLLAETGFAKSASLFAFTLDELTPRQKERCATLLSKLDNDDYDVREAAGKEMLTLGFAAEPELRRVMQDAPSAEVRIRCRRLREELLCKPRATLLGHTDQVEAVAFSPDGRCLATGSRDGSVRLWNVPDFKETARLVPRAP